MESNTLKQRIEKIIDSISELVPKYMEDPIDNKISEGNVSVCIVDENGNVSGRLFGNDKIKSRRTFQIAWTKASQVWITGMNTGEFEKKVFNNEIDDKVYGISKPDFIGWEGGQAIVLKDGTKLSIGFSGFRGFIDIDIVKKALMIVEG